jgi:alkylation response protein AidB-like acyl-CoA dehydrogenase
VDFSFSEEQEIYRSSVVRFVRENYDLDARRRIVEGDCGMSTKHWADFADLGLLALPLPEEFGGLSGSPIDLLVVMEEFGRGLIVEPYFESIILSAGFIDVGGSPAQKDYFLPRLSSGDLILATAFIEQQARYDPADITTTATRDGSGLVLNGKKSVVWAGPWADYFIVTARTSGGQRDATGVSIFIVEADQAGVSKQSYPTIDGSRACELGLANVRVSEDALIGELDLGLSIVDEVFDRARVALCAEAIGAMKVLNETTLEYARTRKQFGQAIGEFQVVKHQLVDMYVAMEEAISITYRAALHLDAEPELRKRAVSGAKAKVGQAARLIGKSAVQLHGGIGVTDELNVGHYFKRLIMIDLSLGDQDYHIGRYAGLKSWT